MLDIYNISTYSTPKSQCKTKISASEAINMKLSFPAMRGRMGKRDYFVAMVKLNLIPKLFKFTDWAELPPEQRAQRVIQKSRIPEITQYILENEDGYLFSALTSSFN